MRLLSKGQQFNLLGDSLLDSASFGDVCAGAKCFPSGSTSPAINLVGVNELILVHSLSFQSVLMPPGVILDCLLEGVVVHGPTVPQAFLSCRTTWLLVLTFLWTFVFRFAFPPVGSRLVYLQV